MRRRPLLFVLVLAWGVFAMGTLGQAVVRAQVPVTPGEAVGGVHLGWSMAQVRSTVGTPRSMRHLRGALGTPELLLHYATLSATLARRNGTFRVVSIVTAAPGARLASGVGVGTSRRLLERRLPTVRCQQTTTCQLGDPRRAGSRITTFFLKYGRVQKIAVSTSLNA